MKKFEKKCNLRGKKSYLYSEGRNKGNNKKEKEGFLTDREFA